MAQFDLALMPRSDDKCMGPRLEVRHRRPGTKPTVMLLVVDLMVVAPVRGLVDLIGASAALVATGQAAMTTRGCLILTFADAAAEKGCECENWPTGTVNVA